MAVIIDTTKPKTLLRKLKSAIDDGSILTWEYDEDGDFTHTPDQWHRLAWMHPQALDGQLRFTIVPPRGKSISVATYAVYHGRLIEAVLRHADQLMTRAIATSFPAHGDQIT